MDSFSKAVKAVERLDKAGNVRKTGSFVETIEDAHAAMCRVRTWYRNRMQWTVTIQSGDRLYDAALRWFLSEDADSAPPRSVRARLSTSRRRFVEEWEDNFSKDAPSVQVLYDEKGSRDFIVDGHKVMVLMHRPQQSFGPNEGPTRMSVQPDQIHFHTWSYAGQQAVLALLDRIVNDQAKAKPALHLMTSWGDWSRRDDLPERQLDSVILARGQVERIRDDLQDFLGREEEYVRRGMPYHRGYLLYGPPGTGKTSAVRALAAHFGLDLWYAPLGDLQKDTSLLTLINQVRAGSILLLEDIDIFNATHNRETAEPVKGEGLSTAGLLNALDGVATPHGLITFMTTNDRSVLDPAILRPGRIDVQEEIGLPDADQIRRLYNSWYSVERVGIPESMNSSIRFEGSTADVTEILKRHLHDSTAALRVLQQPGGLAEERSVTVAALKGKRDERERAG